LREGRVNNRGHKTSEQGVDGVENADAEQGLKR